MHILFVVRYNPFQSPSGTEIFAGNLALELARQGHRVRLVYESRNSSESITESVEGIEAHGLHLISIPYLRALDFRRKYSNYCSKLLNKIDIDAVIAFGAGTFPYYIFNKIDKLKDRPLRIYYAMDTMVMEYERSKALNEAKGLFTGFQMWIWYKALIKSEKASCLKSDLIFASSGDTRNHLICDYGVPPGKIRVLYEGIPDDFTDGIDTIDPNIPTFLHVAGGPRKGTDFLLKAVRLLEKKYGLRAKVIITRANSTNVKQAKELGIDAEIYEYVPSVELKRLYASCTALVSPSLSEGFCLPVVEAAMFGKPTIAFGSGSLPELINDGIDGFIVSVGDIDRLTERMYQISVDNDLRKRMYRAAKEKGQKFGINECSKRFVKILTENRK